jgi:hypothetical protein
MVDEKIRVDPNALTPRDLKRARVMLGGKSPYEILEDDDNREDAIALTIWCIRSRKDPNFTLEDALDVPFSQLEEPDQGPPVNAAPSSDGSNKKVAEKSEQNGMQRSAAVELSSATSSASVMKNTTA